MQAAGPRQSRALHPVYVGCVHDRPPSNEKYTPDSPTPGVNGHVVGSPALHASMSMLSLAPATTSDGSCASIATAGSFCLFCENGRSRFWLPTVTSVPVPSGGGSATGAATAGPAPANTRNNAAPAATNLNVRVGPPLPLRGAMHPGPSAYSHGYPPLTGKSARGKAAAISPE